jgi:biotin carboxyl carrier protein
MIAEESGVVEQAPSPWRELAGFRLNAAPETAVRLFLDGKAIMASGAPDAPPRTVLLDDDGHIVVFEAGEAIAFSSHPPSADLAEGIADGQVRSPMPGKVTQLVVKAGQTVAKGAPLLTLEAMKMEHALTAPLDGKVEEVTVKVGDQVSEGALLVRLAAD